MTAPSDFALEEFITLVRCMRKSQQEYSRTKDRAVLNQCRDWERRVDQTLASLANDNGQLPLFPEDQWDEGVKQ